MEPPRTPPAGEEAASAHEPFPHFPLLHPDFEQMAMSKHDKGWVHRTVDAKSSCCMLKTLANGCTRAPVRPPRRHGESPHDERAAPDNGETGKLDPRGCEARGAAAVRIQRSLHAPLPRQEGTAFHHNASGPSFAP
jgi:hypothetical protein